jgi:hypothetical protein
MKQRNHKRWPAAALALGLFAALGFAQAGKPPPPPAAKAAQATPAQKKLDAIFERLTKAQKEWEDAEDQDKVQEAANAFLDEIEVVAKEAKGTETAAQAWAKYAGVANRLGNVKQVATAVDTLVNEHITSPLLEIVPDMLGNPRVMKADKAEELLRRMMDKSPEKGVKAASMLTLGTKLMNEKKAKPERKAEGRALLEKVQKDYAGVKSTRGQEYAAIACGQIFELDNLQIGQTPADFEVTDENGVKFKLTDYRGKVVVLDFWGIW